MFAGMSGGTNNIDSFIDEQLTSGLSAAPSDMFGGELMKRIALEIEFRDQDVKTHKFASTFMFSLAGLVVAVIALAGYLISKDSSGSEKYSGPVESFAGAIEYASLQVISFLGLSGMLSGATLILIILLSALLYNSAEKYLLRRSSGRGKQV